jgi:hypothetical protein
MHLEAAKLATYHAASLYDRSSPNHPKHDPSITSHAVGVACNSAKYLAAEAAFTACERSVMSMGGMGYAAEYHVERYMRECFVPRIAPVSRVSNFVPSRGVQTDSLTTITGDDHELRWREGVEVAAKLLVMYIDTYDFNKNQNDIFGQDDKSVGKRVPPSNV